MTIKTATPLLAVLALGLGACGGGDSNSATGADADSQSAEDARVKFAQCLREQGIDVEDPSGGGGGLVFRRGRGRGPERSLEEDGGRFEEAAEKCREKLGDAAPPELSEEERQEFQDRALAFARCMREHGIDFPDPEFGEGGRMSQRIERPTDEERFRKAEKACKEFRPEPPGGGARGGPGGGALEARPGP